MFACNNYEGRILQYANFALIIFGVKIGLSFFHGVQYRSFWIDYHLKMYKIFCAVNFMASLKLQFLYPRPGTLKLTCDINLILLRYIFGLELKATLLKSHIKPKEGTYWSKLYYLIYFNIDQLTLNMVHS